MSRKLRIAVWYNLPSGGAKRALNDHLRGLRARGHTLEAWRPPVMQADYLPVSDLIPEHEIPFRLPIQDGRNYLDKISRHVVRQLFMRPAMREHSRLAAAEIERGRFDVLFANTCMFYHSPWVGRYVSIPRLLYLQEPKRNLYEAMPRLPWPSLPEADRRSLSLRSFRRRAKDTLDLRSYRMQAADELQNAQTYDRILVNSNYSRESVLRAYGLESEVCDLGIDMDRFENRGLSREPFVLSVGSFGYSKDPEFVVRAIGTIGKDRPPLVWVANMVDPVYRPRVEAVARELDVDLTVRQYVPDAELLELLNRATAMAYAPRLEPFGYAPLEANACGLPAVVVAEGGVKETVVDGLNGIVVPHRPEAMGAALAGLLADPVAARAMGQRAAAHVRERWTLERATDEIERNLLEVAEGRPNPASSPSGAPQ